MTLYEDTGVTGRSGMLGTGLLTSGLLTPCRVSVAAESCNSSGFEALLGQQDVAGVPCTALCWVRGPD